MTSKAEIFFIALLILFSLIFVIFFVPRYQYDNEKCQRLGYKVGVKIGNETYCLPRFLKID